MDTNTAPVADAGDDQVSVVRRELNAQGIAVDVFEEVTLDGGRSFDPDQDYLQRFYWGVDVVPVGSLVRLESLSTNRTDQPQTRFTPDREGVYGFVLEVFDGQKRSQADYVQVWVERENGTPLADAGPDLNAGVGDEVIFDGSSSADPDGDYLSYQWELVSKPAESGLSSLSLIYPALPNPHLIPDVAGVYTLSLVVSDGLERSARSFVTLTAASHNGAPVAVTSPSTVVTPCYANPVTLDASSSFDPEGDPFTALWSVLEAPYGSLVRTSSLSDPDALTTQVLLDLLGLYAFTVTLDDGISSPSVASVVLILDDGASQEAPVADPGSNRSVAMQSSCSSSGCTPCALQVELDGSVSSDPNGDPLTYDWQVVQGSASFTSASTVTTTLIGPTLQPSAAGQVLSAIVRYQLTVSDCFASSLPVERSVTFTCEGKS